MATPRPPLWVFRVRYMTTSMVPHVYCNVYAAQSADRRFESIGGLTLTKSMFEVFQRSFVAEWVDDLREHEHERSPIPGERVNDAD